MKLLLFLWICLEWREMLHLTQKLKDMDEILNELEKLQKQIGLQGESFIVMNYIVNWNLLDTIIFFCENKLHKVKAVVCDSKEAEPDVELMIQAETAHLKTENECLKKREMPALLLEEEGEYFCPKCQYKQPDQHVRYCANCGHRVIYVSKRIVQTVGVGV